MARPFPALKRLEVLYEDETRVYPMSSVYQLVSVTNDETAEQRRLQERVLLFEYARLPNPDRYPEGRPGGLRTVFPRESREPLRSLARLLYWSGETRPTRLLRFSVEDLFRPRKPVPRDVSTAIDATMKSICTGVSLAAPILFAGSMGCSRPASRVWRSSCAASTGDSPQALARGIRLEALITAEPFKPHVDVGWLPAGNIRLLLKEACVPTWSLGGACTQGLNYTCGAWRLPQGYLGSTVSGGIFTTRPEPFESKKSKSGTSAWRLLDSNKVEAGCLEAPCPLFHQTQADRLRDPEESRSATSNLASSTSGTYPPPPAVPSRPA
eukprot:4246540-Amphidinium_carterae.1